MKYLTHLARMCLLTVHRNNGPHCVELGRGSINVFGLDTRLGVGIIDPQSFGGLHLRERE
jgi:hypothetical protein